MKKEIIILILAIFLFNIFGIYHLAENETVDEHFWKYERIQKYFIGLKKGIGKNNWKDTRINDKPGVTVALLSGLGLPFIPDPQNHKNFEAIEKNSVIIKNESGEKSKEKLYSIYNTDKTFSINFGLKLPILLFNSLFLLPIIFWSIKKSFGSKIALVSILLISLNSILIGISQIINPDALLWSLCFVSILFFVNLLKTGEKKFIILTGIFTGFSLLTKYTANLLFIFYAIIFILYQNLEKVENKPIFNFENLLNKLINKIKNNRIKLFFQKLFSKTLFIKKLFEIKEWNYIFSFSFISLISWFVFSLFLPAVFQNLKHFLYGTIYSPALSPLVNISIKTLKIKNFLFLDNNNYRVFPMLFFSLFLFILIFIFIPIFINKFISKKLISNFSKIFLIVFLSIFVISFFNAWTNETIFKLNNQKESTLLIGNTIIKFPQFENDNKIFYFLKSFLFLAQGFIFSIHPLQILTIFVFSFFIVFNKVKRNLFFIYFVIYTFFIFFIGALISKTFVVARYVIIIYPLLCLFTGIGLVFIFEKLLNFDLQKFFKKFNFLKINENFLFMFLIIFIIISHLFSLILIKPFYFNYTSFLLPKKFNVSDTIGYGSFEIANYLNSLPNAKDKVIWTDRLNICEFFIGKCISDKVYLDYTKLDYLIINQRSLLTKRPEIVKKDKNFNIENSYTKESLENPEFEVIIGNRPNNFIKILKVK